VSTAPQQGTAPSLPGTGRGDHAQAWWVGFTSDSAIRPPPHSPQNRIDHTGQIAVDIAVPEAQDDEAVCDELAIPLTIAKSLTVSRMSATIEFDCDPLLQASKVENVAQPRHLATKVEAGLSHLPKLQPQLDLLRRHSFPQSPRPNDFRRPSHPTHHANAWSPLPILGRDGAWGNGHDQITTEPTGTARSLPTRGRVAGVAGRVGARVRAAA
jgi:hypothetical protein